jgi:Fungal cellulose binding domain
MSITSSADNGFLAFWLCDTSETGDIQQNPEWFRQKCHELQRHPHSACEAGTERDCGPIDPQYPGRWVLPCRTGESDQIFGGPSGKMAYKLPNVEISRGVIQAWWATANSCSPSPFMANYNYPANWAGCPGDGGVTGAHPTMPGCVEQGQTPEEFFGCSDVRLSQNASFTTPPSESNTVIDSTSIPSTSAVPTSTISAEVNTSSSTHSPAYSSQVSPSPSPGCEQSHHNANQDDHNSSAEFLTGSCTPTWQQCGGKGHSGPTSCCSSSAQCRVLNDYYSQCVPNA